MPFFVKTEIIKKEYLINNDVKRKIINEHIDWVKKLKKEGKFFDNFFTAKGSLMYSPNANKDLKNLDRKIDINNIFTHNRLSLDDTVEGGQTLTLGGE